MVCFVLEASHLMEGLTTVPGVNLDTFRFINVLRLVQQEIACVNFAQRLQ